MLVQDLTEPEVSHLFLQDLKDRPVKMTSLWLVGKWIRRLEAGRIAVLLFLFLLSVVFIISLSCKEGEWDPSFPWGLFLLDSLVFCFLVNFYFFFKEFYSSHRCLAFRATFEEFFPYLVDSYLPHITGDTQ